MIDRYRCLAVVALLILAVAPAMAQHAETEHDAHTPAADTHDSSHEMDAASTGHEGIAHEGSADGHGDAHDAAAHDQPSLLSPDLGSAVWSVVLFILLLIVLGKFVWPPILKGLIAREQRIRDDLDEAARANKDAKETLAQYESQLAEAQAESRKLIEQARKDADEMRGRMTSETEQQITQMRQRATEEIRLARQEAVQDLYAQTAQLATAVAGKILQRQINADDADRLVEQSLKELEDRRAG